MFPEKKSAYRRNFDQIKCLSFFIKDKNCQNYMMKFGKKLATLSKTNLTLNLYKMKNI